MRGHRWLLLRNRLVKVGTVARIPLPTVLQKIEPGPGFVLRESNLTAHLATPRALRQRSTVWISRISLGAEWPLERERRGGLLVSLGRESAHVL